MKVTIQIYSGLKNLESIRISPTHCKMFSLICVQLISLKKTIVTVNIVLKRNYYVVVIVNRNIETYVMRVLAIYQICIDEFNGCYLSHVSVFIILYLTVN